MCVCVERESVYDFNVRMYVYDMCTCVRMHVHISYYTIHMKHVCFAVCFRMLQSIVLCCSVMQCVVVCCSVSRTMYLVLQCVAVCCSVYIDTTEASQPSGVNPWLIHIAAMRANISLHIINVGVYMCTCVR